MTLRKAEPLSHATMAELRKQVERAQSLDESGHLTDEEEPGLAEAADLLRAYDAERAAHAETRRKTAEVIHFSESRLAALVAAAEQYISARDEHDDLNSHATVNHVLEIEADLRAAISSAKTGGQP